MANKQTGKQAKSSIKTDTGPADKPARKRETQRRNPRARSRSAAAQTDAAAVLPEASSKRGDGLKDTPEAVDQAGARPEPVLEAGDLGTASVPGADRPPASTKRAMLIGILERPEGASVAEIGQRLGWLPHTVRAAITGLRHAGREVTRSKAENGQSVYRLDAVKITKR